MRKKTMEQLQLNFKDKATLTLYPNSYTLICALVSFREFQRYKPI